MLKVVWYDPPARTGPQDDKNAMPTYQRLPRFDKDFEQLSHDERERFRQAVAKFVDDIERGRSFRRSLRVKGVQGAPGVFEMTWAPDGRATFHYGEPVREGDTHVVWRRVGTHAVLGSP
jgi:hypothetical protein